MAGKAPVGQVSRRFRAPIAKGGVTGDAARYRVAALGENPAGAAQAVGNQVIQGVVTANQ
ncbi:MAG: hypothetical protein M5U34_00980 [Chloroflexi bacterium]|nr:hypothetical protein [Chloroflexota bacterium]